MNSMRTTMSRFRACLLFMSVLCQTSILSATPCNNSICGIEPYPSNTGYETPSPIIDSPQVWSFVSAPKLHPMKVVINHFDANTSKGFVFLAPYGFSSQPMYGQSGSLILDNFGTPIWFRPLSNPNLMNSDFRVQTYRNKPVLTFWQGTLATPPAYTNVPPGSSEPGSCYYILNAHYEVISTLSAHHGYTADIHEFLITPRNTALFLSTKAIPMDLTPYGGPADGYVQDFAIQEVDIKTKQLVFFWKALDHIPLSDSYEPASNASQTGNIWDAYHLNSIGLTDDPHCILVSSRSMWTIYKINKPSKQIVWKLGGKSSDFVLEKEAEFSWQHDARFITDQLISLFNDNSNGSSPPGPSSHGLILQLNFATMTANRYRSYFHDPNVTVASQGNMQPLPNGHKFIGWGQSPYYSEFKQTGNTETDPTLNFLYDAAMPSSNYSYRAYRHKWKGYPHFPPAIAVRSNGEEVTVYASWNGATEVERWRVLAGLNPKKLSWVNQITKSGFETAIPVNSLGPYFQVEALDKKGHVIGISKIIKKSVKASFSAI